jgi:ketosteroid isomerase-like protein
MTKRSLGFLVCLAFFLLSSTFSRGQTTAKKRSASAAQMKFQRLIDRYYAAWNTGDPEKASVLYAKDSDLVFYDLAPLKYTGWAEYDKGARVVLGSFASLKVIPNSDMHVTRHGSIAWTTVTFHLTGKKKTGENVELDGRHTAIWELRNGHWLIVHEHFSVPLS